ncbi:hypothetical protein QN372_14455 [Undibacterium sp. RTI2.1]|uniref:hypothetical protein n=1 Tax=unclassified Undibacterium TaxID=2630295 RepID=UPI002B23810F|nr:MULTISPECIES: hypothetical protein [unclassified Undibacterium]MEB0031958.1 hypothetical protein [Undibacterium sp. RTI2.1]MEB0114880.1 hypothetical protein [Undibacterium sp. RTI2.2]MEB0231538.1 hypothetical protein [Undibacterium sp. 10I3]MEB0255839.1 hypothetical protein [Undibacterium sp. 5I1]
MLNKRSIKIQKLIHQNDQKKTAIAGSFLEIWLALFLRALTVFPPPLAGNS